MGTYYLSNIHLSQRTEAQWRKYASVIWVIIKSSTDLLHVWITQLPDRILLVNSHKFQDNSIQNKEYSIQNIRLNVMRKILEFVKEYGE